MINVTPVILCGGSGTRLWPLSRTGFPKQFLCLTGNEKLFQHATQRLFTLGCGVIQVDKSFIGARVRINSSELKTSIGGHSNH